MNEITKGQVLLTSAAVLGGLYVLFKKWRNSDSDVRKRKVQWNSEWKREVVYLHVFPRRLSRCVPNLSPFAIKLETWLRMNDINYELIDYMGFSSKGQTPFIMFNGEEIPDSNFCIEYLSKYFNTDVHPGMSRSEKGISRAFLKMTEEQFLWTIFWYRYVHHPSDEYINYVTINRLMLMGIGKGFQDRAKKQGLGRHSNDEIYQIGSDDVRAISGYLGDKKFFMGDKPSLIDCSLFGALTQLVYVPMNFPMMKVVREECPNILSYIERMKDTYWKDWDEQMI